MNTIQLIPVDQLLHHPQNPRLDLGDLTELTESIRQNGVMQNLTVVQADDGIYNVVIGNRRMEAAKLAGLAEVPCVVSDMDYKTQIATMLMENMQRQDLTVYEQAQGFQMMMDLGFTAKEIGEKTGFSEKTVKDRIKFTKFNQKNFEKAVAAGATLLDMIEISKLESKADQNEVMKEAGTNNFRQALIRKLNDQKYAKGCIYLQKIAEEAGLDKLPDDIDRWSSCYNRGEVGKSTDPEDKIRKAIKKAVKTAENKKLYYRTYRTYADSEAELNLYEMKEQKSEEELTADEQAQKEAEREKNRYRRKVRKLWAEAYQLRLEFVKNYTLANGASLTTIGKQITKYALSQKKDWGNQDLTENHSWKAKYIREALGISREEYETQESIYESAEKQEIPKIRVAIAWIMGGGVFDCDTPESRLTDWDENYSEKGPMANMIKERYEFLKEIGYVMSDMEIQLMDGTHECYKREV